MVGSAAVQLPADQAELTVSVDVLRTDPADAFRVAADRVAAVLDRLHRHGVAERDVRTVGLHLGPRTSYSNGTEVLLGYACTQRLLARTSSLDTIPDLLAALVGEDAEAIRLDGIAFLAADSDDALAQARSSAIGDGNRKAAHYAQLVGRELGRVTALRETAGNSPAPLPKPARLAAAAPMPVAPGEAEVVVTVEMHYDLR